MEESRRKIIAMSKLIRLTSFICMLLFGGMFFLALIGTLYPYRDDAAKEILSKIVDSSNLLPTDLVHYFMGDSDPVLQIRLSFVFVALLAALLFALIYGFRKVFKTIINSRTPFTKKTCTSISRLSYKALLLALFSTLIGLAVFMVLRLFTYIFEYGTYLQAKADETNRIQEEMIMSFAEITENKSEQTGKHVRRVAEYTRIMAAELGLDEDKADRVRLASTMHDIGKLLIPAEILDKPAKLTDEEFAVIKKHPGYGGELLENVEGEVMQMAKTVALEHHERPDGRGYPSGKTGEDLSLEGKIVAVADVYDALTSKRSYKQAWDEKDAYNEIVKGRGTQFDAAVVDAFVKTYPEINEARQRLQG